MRFQLKTIIAWVLLKLPFISFAVEEASNTNFVNRSTDVVLLKFPLQSLRHPRQYQQGPPAAQATNHTTPRPEIIPWKANPGTAINVQHILTGLFTSDVRPIITGSAAFIPQGNLQESVHALLVGLTPVLQNILFGPGPDAQYQNHHPLPNHNQNQTQVAQNLGATSVTANEPTTTTMAESNRQPMVTAHVSPTQLESDTQLKVEVESGSEGKNKEYIYLVLKPEEYEEYVKISMLNKNKTSAREMPSDSTELKINMTLPTLHPPHDNEDDEYEAFVLNNVTDLHLRDFFFNGTHYQTKNKSKN